MLIDELDDLGLLVGLGALGDRQVMKGDAVGLDLAARSGWLEMTSGISASSSPASQRQRRSSRQWAYLETRTAMRCGRSA